ncbi:ParA family protein [bacterium]|nr:ParA family protein [bacterium]
MREIRYIELVFVSSYYKFICYNGLVSGQIIAIVNQKGGVGKTTTSINLSSFLGEMGHKVLLVDFDPQANATSGIGLRGDQIKKHSYHLLDSNQDVSEVLYPTPFQNLHILPATQDLAGAEVELSNMVSRETILKDRLRPLLDYYDYIIIDCAPSLGLLTVNALCAAHQCLIPVQCEYYALEGIAGLLKTLELVKGGLNPMLRIIGIVLTMYDSRTSLNRQVIDNARAYFKGLVFDSVIPRNIRLAEAPSHGLPILLYSASSTGSLAYSNLAKEFIQRVQ